MAINTADAVASSGIRLALRNRRFRLVWIGETISQIGDQFYFVSLPLFVYMVTGSAAQLGIILLIEGIPRAVFTLFGGAITDRLSPHRVMLLSNSIRSLITLLLAVLIISQTLQIWMIYLAAFCFGTVDAFFQPAFMAFVPMVTDADSLQASNSLVQGSNQLTYAVGPGIAGVVVKVLGIGAAVFLDALTFIFTTVILLVTRPAREITSEIQDAPSTAHPTLKAMLSEIAAMLQYVWKDPTLRPYVPLLLVINLALTGPLNVGTVVLAQTQYSGSSIALGVMFSALGAGSVFGTLLSSRLTIKGFGRLFLFCVALNGLCFGVVSLLPPLLLTMLAFGIVGTTLGLTNVLLLTWFGKQIPDQMMGRFMSLYVLLGTGTMPLSNALVGVLFGANATMTFLLAGAVLIITAGCGMLSAPLRRMSL